MTKHPLTILAARGFERVSATLWTVSWVQGCRGPGPSSRGHEIDQSGAVSWFMGEEKQSYDKIFFKFWIPLLLSLIFDVKYWMIILLFISFGLKMLF